MFVTICGEGLTYFETKQDKMTQSFFDRRDNILKSGKWFSYPWWEENQFKNKGYSKNEIKIAFDELAKLFDENWFLKKIRYENNSLHPLLTMFYSDCYFNFHFFVSLGLALCEFKSKKIQIDNLKKALKVSKQYSGAYWEVMILDFFIKCNCSIEREPRSGNKKADIKVSKNSETLSVECKKLEMSGYNKTVSDLTSQLIHNVTSNPKIREEPVFLNLELSKKLFPALISKKVLFSKDWEAISTQIEEEISYKIKFKKWGKHVIEGIVGSGAVVVEGFGICGGGFGVEFATGEFEAICDIFGG